MKTLAAVLALLLLASPGVEAADQAHPSSVADGKWCARMLPGKKLAAARRECLDSSRTSGLKAAQQRAVSPWARSRTACSRRACS
jgi:hypothetical protein